MANRKKSPEGPKSLEDATHIDVETSAMLAAVDQFEAEKSGEANEPPSEREASELEFEPVLETPPPEAPSQESGKPKLVSQPLRVFLSVCGHKWDQMAGFKHYATKNNLGPLTIPEWRMALEAFRKRPTR